MVRLGDYMKIILRTLIILLALFLIGILSAYGVKAPNPIMLMLGLITISLIGIFIVLLKRL